MVSRIYCLDRCFSSVTLILREVPVGSQLFTGLALA